MLIRRLPLIGLPALLTLTLPQAAQAAPGNDLTSETPSFYLYGSPFFFGVPIGDDDVTDLVKFSYQWGFGLGGLFGVGPRKNFGIGFGFAFEHNPATLDDDYDDLCDSFDVDCSIHAFRFLPELRLGYLWRQLFVYGYVAPGFGMIYSRADSRFVDDDDDVDPGFDFGFGGGAQYLVYKGLFIGGELGFDMGIYTNDEDDIGDDDYDYDVYIFDFKALIGYYF